MFLKYIKPSQINLPIGDEVKAVQDLVNFEARFSRFLDPINTRVNSYLFTKVFSAGSLDKERIIENDLTATSTIDYKGSDPTPGFNETRGYSANNVTNISRNITGQLSYNSRQDEINRNNFTTDTRYDRTKVVQPVFDNLFLANDCFSDNVQYDAGGTPFGFWRTSDPEYGIRYFLDDLNSFYLSFYLDSTQETIPSGWFVDTTSNFVGSNSFDYVLDHFNQIIKVRFNLFTPTSVWATSQDNYLRYNFRFYDNRIFSFLPNEPFIFEMSSFRQDSVSYTFPGQIFSESAITYTITFEFIDEDGSITVENFDFIPPFLSTAASDDIKIEVVPPAGSVSFRYYWDLHIRALSIISSLDKPIVSGDVYTLSNNIQSPFFIFTFPKITYKNAKISFLQVSSSALTAYSLPFEEQEQYLRDDLTETTPRIFLA